MIYNQINNQNKAVLKDKIESDSWFTIKADFLQDENLIIDGYYVDDSNVVKYIVFGKIVVPESTEQASIGIFAKLKAYGQSGKYKGIMSPNGDVLIPNNYHSIEYCPFRASSFLVSRKGQVGIIQDDGKLIISVSYERLFDAGERTIGFIKDGLMGFMNLNGLEVIKEQYEPWVNSEQFEDGLASVHLRIDGTRCYAVIDHYGLFESVEIADYICDDNDYHEQYLGTGYYPYGDLPDALDAYEGDSSNRWNTD